MGCYRPLEAWQLVTGEVHFSANGRGSARPDRGIRRELSLPCGQCIGCRLERTRQWAVRCVHESKMHDASSFVTLTYDDEHAPQDHSLNYKHFQAFAKRFRKAYGPFRFFMCGEYGDDFSRPHFHAALFGVDFPDKYLWSESGGVRLYRSDFLERLWPLGYSSIGDLTFQSAAYIAGYVTKKVNGKRQLEHYEAVDAETGQIFQRTPEFSRMSLKPGIGAPFYEKYHSEIFPNDQVVIDGTPQKPPKAYAKWLKQQDPDKHEEVATERYKRALEASSENTAARLAIKEAVAKGRSKFYESRNKL